MAKNDSAAAVLDEEEMQEAVVDTSALPEGGSTEQPSTAPTRKAIMRQMYKDGKSRGEIAKEMGVQYATVYAVTKDMGNQQSADGSVGGNTISPGGGPRVFLKLPGEDGDGTPRAEVIRQLAKPKEEGGEGLSRGQIVKVLKERYGHETSFQVVYAATRANPPATANASAKAADTNVDVPEDVVVENDMESLEGDD